MELSATTPSEMVEAHCSMISWARQKIEVLKGQAEELRVAFEHAKRCKWKWDTLKRHYDLMVRRVTFYEKIRSALEAGYCIVPNFPVTLFAIRTTSKKPRHDGGYYAHARAHNFEQDAKVLPQGEGEYKNPQPLVRCGTTPKEFDHGTYKEKKHWCWADAWEALEFPANMARLHVMHAADRAMALKIFDEVGMLPADHKRNPDPLLIGRIIDPRPPGWGDKKRVSFMIAWHIDTSTI